MMVTLTPQMIGFLSIAGLLILIVFRAPIAIAMVVSGLAGISAILGFSTALSLLESVPMDVGRRYSFTIIPLFLLMGNLAVQSGLSGDLFMASKRLLARWKTGLPLASLTACGAFSAVSGSSLATAATMGRVAIPELTRNGYSPKIAAGTLAAGGTLGIMIPPSIGLLLYALITEQSVSTMFMAGIVPGILAFALYCVTVIIWQHFYPIQSPSSAPVKLSKRHAALKALPALVLFVAVMGGLYTGLFTPTEAAGSGAFLALIFALARGMRWAGFLLAVEQTVQASAMIFLIIIGAEVFGYLLSLSQITFDLIDLIRSWQLQPWQVLLIILGFFIVFGLFMDSLAIILLTVPIFFPLVVEFGIHPIWFGILAVVAIEIGLITPPVGLNLFVIRTIAPNISMRDVMVGALPFVGTDLIRLLILLAWPWLSLGLPDALGLLP